MHEVKVYISLVASFTSDELDRAEALGYEYISRIKTNCPHESFEASVETTDMGDE